MHADVHRRVHAGMVAVAVAVVLAVAGCGTGPDDDASPPEVAATTTPADPATPAATATAQDGPATTPAPATAPPTAETYRPPDLDWLPPEEELVGMVAQAAEAYRAHWALYDAAALAGFADPDLQEALLATAGEDTLESLRLQAAAIGEEGRVVEGTTEIAGIEHVGLNPPEEGGHGIGVLFDACLLMQGVLKESDGTVVRELDSSEPSFVRARLVDDDGSWLLVSQTGQDGPCPDALLGRGTGAG